MEEKTETIDAQENKLTDVEADITENEYKIFDYFKEHTGLLIASVSALVAVMSYVFRFAVGRMNYAYLEYWDIATLYANTDNQNELHMIVGMLFIILAIIFIHWVLSGTSKAFRYYAKLLSVMKRDIMEAKKESDLFNESLEEVSKDLASLTPEEEKDPVVQELKASYERCKKGEEERNKLTEDLKKIRRKLWGWVFIQIVLSVLFAYLIGSLFLMISESTVTLKEGIQNSKPIIVLIISYILLYFVPVIISNKHSAKQGTQEAEQEKMVELLDGEFPKFPFEKLLSDEVKSVFSDKNIGFIAFELAVFALTLLFYMPSIGAESAERKLSFPIYNENGISYAIVYIDGPTKFMEVVEEQGGTLVIDTTKQRIITTDDISYTIKAFKDISVIRIDDEEKFAEEPNFLLKTAIDKVSSFFETAQSNAEEVTVENEGSISGNECEPEAGG